MSSNDTARDALMRQMRDQIVDTDVALIGLLNTRLQHVARLWAYKAEHDLPMVDQAREEWMHRFIQGANRGPVSAEGLDVFYRAVLDLTKREVRRMVDDV